MLFYERVVKEDVAAEQSASVSSPIDEPLPSPKYKFEMSDELADWIWKDNTSFLQDKNIFCHHYFR